MRAGVPAETRRAVVGCGLLLTAGFVALSLFPPRGLRDLDSLGYDALLRRLRAEPRPPDVAILDIDARSLDALGQWPWPRYRIAELLDRARAAGVRSIGVDLLFAEPDRTSLDRLTEQYARDRGVELSIAVEDGTEVDHDRLLAAALERGTVVLGAHLEFELTSPPHPYSGQLPTVVQRAEPGAPTTAPVPAARGATWPLEGLARSASFIGAVNSLPDGDGKFRRMPLVVRHGEHPIPSLALATLLAATGEDRVTLRVSRAGVTGIELGGNLIPTDRQGSLLLPFRGRPTERFDHVSASDLLAGRVAPERLRDKIVFLGSTASGLHDEHPVPVMRSCPGVDLHALAVDAMLRRDFITEPAWAAGAQLVLVLAAGLFATFLMTRTSVTRAALLAVGASAGLALGSWLLIDQAGIALSPVPAGSTLLVGFATLALVRFRRDERRALEHVRELSAAQHCTILSLVSLVETRDPETGRHIVRTQHFARALALRLAQRAEFRAELTAENVEAIYKGAPLHDVGKVGVPDAILLKAGNLTLGEFEQLKRHTVRGHEVLRRAEEQAGLPRETSFLRYAKEMTLHHHERWDGTGYPHGLRGDAIPLSARVLALADVYDALRHERSYKPAYSHAKTRAMICEASGSHFDPRVVEVFLDIEDEFQAICDRYPNVASRDEEPLDEAWVVPAEPGTPSEVVIELEEQR